MILLIFSYNINYNLIKLTFGSIPWYNKIRENNRETQKHGSDW